MSHVTFVTDALGPGGAERQLVLLASELLRVGWQPEILRYYAQDFHAIPDGVPAHLLPRRGPADPRLMAALLGRLRRDRTDLVHTWKPQAAVYAGAAALGPRRPPVLLHLHTGRAFLERRPLAARSYLLAAALSDHVVGVAEDGLDWLAAHGLPRERMRWLPNLLGRAFVAHPALRGEAALEPLRDLGYAHAEPPVAIIGRVDANKNASGVVRGLAALAARGVDVPPVLMLGEVTEPDELARAHEAAASAGLRLHHHTPIDGIEVVLDAAQLVVLGSHAEGQPMVVIEAMARGRRVVAPSTGAIPSLIDDGRTGFLVPQQAGRTTDDALAETLARALAQPQAAATAMGAAAKQAALAGFGPDAVTARWTALYDQLRAERAGPMLPFSELAGARRWLAGLRHPGA
jgi:glycosyltransferase involved in cell wall biosynthesis